MKIINVAIDGPAGAGKSTISRKAAAELGYIYIDTGALYRTVGLNAVRKGADLESDESIIATLTDDVKVELRFIDGEQRMFLCGEDVSDKIRTLEVSQGASDVAVIPEVRIKLVELQRQIASAHDVVMDGRDIGTYVLPNATVKIFLTASSYTRAKRRYKENIEKGIECDYEEMKAEIEARDKQDMNREVSPLKKADDAIELDTSNMSLEEVVAHVMDLVEKKLEE